MDPAGILDLIGKGGIVALLVIVWYLEKTRADKAQADLLQLTKDQAEDLATFKGVLEKVAEGLAGANEGIKQIATFIQRRRQ